MIGEDEKVVLIAAPNTAEYIKANDPDIKNALIICEFMEEGHVLMATVEEWLHFTTTADTYQLTHPEKKLQRII